MGRSYIGSMYRLAIKNAFMFIGSMIGAGFATGAELMVFFRESDSITLILSAFIIGGMSMVFAVFGRVCIRYPRLNSLIELVMVLMSILTFITMQAGIEDLFLENYGIVGLGLISAIVIGILSKYSLNFTRKLNVVLIPIIIIMIITLAISARPMIIGGKIQPMQALSYASMNLLLGGYLIAKDSQGMKLKHSFCMAAIITVIVAIMLIIMLNLSRLGSGSIMPIYAVAISEGLGGIACGIIFLAIITTMIGAGKIVTLGINRAVSAPWLGSIFLVLLSVVCFGAKFGYMVDTFYPISGYVGMGILLIVIVMTIFDFLRARLRRKLF